MHKRFVVVTIALVLAFIMAVPAAFASPPAVIVTGSIWVEPTHKYDPPPPPEFPEFPPPYEPIEPDGINRLIVFNARGTAPDEVDFWEATGHLHWNEGRDKYTVRIHTMLPPDHPWAWWAPERCIYIAGAVVSGPSGHPDHLCFVVCDDGASGRSGSFVYVAAWDYGTMYRYDVLRGNVVILD